MARIKVPYLVRKGGAAPRFYWQPSAALVKSGWRCQRIPDEWQSLAGPALEAAAIAKARALNAELGAWRDGAPAPHAPGQNAPGQHASGGGPKGEQVGPGTVAHAIAAYRQSRFYTRLRPSTRRVYDQNLDLIERWAGDTPLRSLTTRAVQTLYASLSAKTPTRANHVIGMLRNLLAFCRRDGMVQINVAERPGLVGRPPSGIIWPRAAVALMVRHADALGAFSIGSAILLNEWLGQREADILALPRPALKGSTVIWQAKTKARVDLPIDMVPHLAERIRAEIERHAGRTVVPMQLILDERTGQPYTEHVFRKRFAEIRARAAAETPGFPSDQADRREIATLDLVFMHLRHTAITRLAEAGCTAEEIRSISGHTKRSIDGVIERYLSRTGEMARSAFAQRMKKEERE